MDHDSHNVSDLRHFPTRQAVVKRRRTTNHIVRSTAKRVAEWGSDSKQGERAKIARFDPSKKITRPRGPAADHAAASSDASRRRARLEKDIRSIIHFRGSASASGSAQQRERRAAQRETLLTADETIEGRELASSDVPLPSDRFRLARTPSLERQEAFRVESTAKSKSTVRVCHVGPASGADDAQIAALYGMGLLYDGDRDYYQQPVFDLNSIKHEEPVYTVRLAKRGRRGGKKTAAGAQEGTPVQLDLSFTGLGNHSAIAQYIKAPLGQSPSGRGGGGKGAAQRSARQSAPLRVVFGANGRNPSFDVETSQADLIGDSFSDYECLSDSEMDDDLPSQREIREPSTNLRCDTWIILG